ncbi:MAG: phosphoserine phosphatase SerB [Bdellovibrionales bacterium]|nr:phosphoserine phosphatase SerB [Bdellovibrionales bacterium]
MILEYVVVCVSEQVMPDRFRAEIKQILLHFKCHVHKSERKKTGLYYHVEATHMDLESLNASFMNLALIHNIDIAFIPKALFETKKGLVIFDMDSTLITAEVIDEMAVKHGIGEKVKKITVRAMNGEMGFDQSLTERVSLLEGFDRRHMEDIMDKLVFTPGTPEFIKVLQKLGIKTAIASGGFQYFAKTIQAKLKIDYVFANDLEFENDKLTGKILGPIVNAASKEQIVIDLAAKEGLTLEQVVAIGDGANDIPMLLKAGLGIAIHAKEKVQKAAHYRINFGPMTSALSFMNHETV